MKNNNKSKTYNNKVYNQWAIMLDTYVENGVCWEIAFLCKSLPDELIKELKSKNRKRK